MAPGSKEYWGLFLWPPGLTGSVPGQEADGKNRGDQLPDDAFLRTDAVAGHGRVEAQGASEDCGRDSLRAELAQENPCPRCLKAR
jgi:hypothetical protein